MIKMIDDYIQHIEESGNKSLLARIYGIFTLKMSGLRKINIIIMQNTAKLFNESEIDFNFDIKGSLHGRKSPYNIKQEEEIKQKLTEMSIEEEDTALKKKEHR